MVTNNSKDQPTAASGKVLQGQGVGTACNFSTATYPSTATGTGTILRADGTNWTPTTATYPNTAGSNTNVLTSDGTNWNSSAASSGAFYSGSFITTSGGPADSLTYYMCPLLAFTNTQVGSFIGARFYATTACTITKVYGAFSTVVAGSNENCTLFIRVNDTSNTNISTTIQLTSADVSFNNSALSISLSAGDYFTVGFTGAAWGTNPTSVGISMSWSS